MTGPRIGSLFAGTGALDLAVMNVFGGAVAWHCENEAAPSKILAHHWPDVPNLHDVTTVDWSQVEPVDILTGGYPCGPFSGSGERKGTDDERHLWPYVRQAIRALRPRLTLLENVAGHRSLGFDQVLSDLAADGLHARWVSVRASNVGAPHKRERLFILVTPPNAAINGLDERGHSLRAEAGRAEVNGDQLPLPRSFFGEYGNTVWHWERITRTAPAPTEKPAASKRRLNAAFAEWMMGLPAGHVTAVPGLSYVDQIKAIGNGVVPQQCAEAIRQLLVMQTPELKAAA